MSSKAKNPKPCPEKKRLQDRDLISCDQALEVEGLFEILANDTRLRLIHEITRQGEACVMDLANALEMKPQAISNQLQRLADKRILASRRDGNNVFYRVIDNCVMIMLERGLCLIEEDQKRSNAST